VIEDVVLILRIQQDPLALENYYNRRLTYNNYLDFPGLDLDNISGHPEHSAILQKMSHHDSSSDMSSMGMVMVFTTSHRTPLFANSWTPKTDGAYAGTCIFLILLAMMLRSLFAVKTICEVRWKAAARNRRYVLVRGQTTEAGRIDQNPDAKVGSLVTAQGVEENVKVVQADIKGAIPFRLSVDFPRAILSTLIAGVSYLL
jgi:hypothetical protein